MRTCLIRPAAEGRYPALILSYDQAGADKGNFNKFAKELTSYDDARAILN